MKNLLYLFTFLAFSFLNAQDGSLDTSFGINGLQSQEFDCNHMYLNSVLELDNGSIFMSGYWYIDEYTTFLMQINEDGEPVLSYGNSGFMELPSTFEIKQIEKQLPNNLFLVYGKNTAIYDGEDGFYRIDVDGAVDLSYGTNGALIPTLNQGSRNKYLVLDDASVMIASYNNMSITIKKYTANGIIDEAFAEINIPLANDQNIDQLFDFNISENGKFNVGLREINGADFAHFIYNINNDGSLNENFGDDGAVVLPEPEFTKLPYRIKLTVLQNNQIVVSRYHSYWWGDGSIPTETKLYKVNANGAILNANFGNDGVLTIPNFYGSVVEQPNGRLLYFGVKSDLDGGLNPLMKRYNPQGVLDTSFNFTDNFIDFGSVSLLNNSNEKIYLLGTNPWYSDPTNFIAMRYNNSPLSVKEENFIEYSIFPNPSSDVFNINSPSGLPILSLYSVYDLKRTLLMQGIFQQKTNEIDLSPFEKGIYLLKVENSILKLVKQ